MRDPSRLAKLCILLEFLLTIYVLKRDRLYSALYSNTLSPIPTLNCQLVSCIYPVHLLWPADLVSPLHCIALYRPPLCISRPPSIARLSCITRPHRIANPPPTSYRPPRCFARPSSIHNPARRIISPTHLVSTKENVQLSRLRVHRKPADEQRPYLNGTEHGVLYAYTKHI